MSESFIQIPPDSTGKQIATNEVGGKQYQIVNVADESGAPLNPLTDAQLRAVALPVSADTLPLPDGAATAAKQQEISDISDTILTLVQTLTARTPRLDAAGRVVGNNSETTQPVSGTVTVGTISTVTTVGNQTLVGGYSPANSMFGVPLHIYNNIVVS